MIPIIFLPAKRLKGKYILYGPEGIKLCCDCCKRGSISRAAEKLFMSQSSLSQGDPHPGAGSQDLCLRPHYPRSPANCRWRCFISMQSRSCSSTRAACSEAADIENLNGGTVIFGISTYRGTYLLPPVLKRFRALYPKVHVEICEMDGIDLEDQLLEGLLDLALIAAPPVRIRHGVSPFMRVEIMIVTTADHPVMEFARTCESDPELSWIDLKDTAAFEYIFGPPNTVLGRVGRQALRDAGIEPIGQGTDLSASFAAAMAREGAGLAFTYRSCRVPGDHFRYLRMGKKESSSTSPLHGQPEIPLPGSVSTGGTVSGDGTGAAAKMMKA